MAPLKFSSFTSQLCSPALAYGRLYTSPWGKISGWNQPTHSGGSVQVESTIFIVNTYVNVAFLRLLLSVVQLANTDQHLEEELMFCAQANPLSQ